MQPADLVKIRTKLGLNQTEFGVRLGYAEKGAQRCISAMETGERPIKPVVAILASYMQKFGVEKFWKVRK